ncbi:IclR family transcriptional regulator [Halostella sp. JP-L12]|uniref:IclR family transcriptional regulator n=1 Tax=Halostella TaxID=1843185 RepID=UPI000EF7DDA6|nr:MULTISPECIES: IclR family transcriptional regulator [Halostella]NHN49449.1 IclR family transcriptional regulator [Halostella sp. JP-L12]
MTDASRTIGAVETACTVIDVLEDRLEVGVSELADELGVTKGTAHSYLASLEKRGFVVAEDGRYSLSLRYLGLGETVRNRIEAVDVVEAELAGLASEFGERAQFGMPEGGRAVYVHRETGSEAVNSTFRVGDYEYLHAVALGKAMLAHLPDERVDAAVDEHGLPAYTENTVATRAELDEHLERIRERGYAVDDEERVRGVRCLAVPVLRDGGDVVGAMSVSGPKRRMTDERLEGEILDGLRRAVNVVEVNAQLS